MLLALLHISYDEYHNSVALAPDREQSKLAPPFLWSFNLPPELNGRVPFWNIGYPLGTVVYLISLLALIAVLWSLYQRSKIWRLGTPNPDVGPWGARLRAGVKTMLLDSIGHRRFIHRERYPGTMHFLIVWGMLILFVATTLDALEFNAGKYLGVHLFTENVKVERELVWDIGGLMLIAGVVMAAYRRYVIKPPRLNTMLENGVLLALLLSMALSGFVLQSLRMAATELDERVVQSGVGAMVVRVMGNRPGDAGSGRKPVLHGGFPLRTVVGTCRADERSFCLHRLAIWTADAHVRRTDEFDNEVLGDTAERRAATNGRLRFAALFRCERHQPTLGKTATRLRLLHELRSM